MSAFADKNSNARAVGNVSMNARGDVVDSQNRVKVSANKISQAFSAVNNKKVRQVSLKEDAEAAPVVSEPVKADPVPEPKPVVEPVVEVQQPVVVAPVVDPAAPSGPAEVSRRAVRTDTGPAYEIEYEDGSMEIIPIKS